MTILRLEKVNRILIAALLVACAHVAGCNDSRDTRDASGTGGTGGTGTSTVCSGTFNGSCRISSGAECLDYSNLPDSAAVASIDAMCQEDGLGSWNNANEAACTQTGALGACREMQGTVCRARWVYRGTLAEAMADCTDNLGTWVNP